MSRIFMLCGLSDIEVAGNQSSKNTIKYLEYYGNSLDVFTFLPWGYQNLRDPAETFGSDVRFHRLPKAVASIMDCGRRAKNVIGHAKVAKNGDETLQPTQSVEYHEEYNIAGRLIYILFLFLVYLPFEFLRITWFILFRERPDLLYGLNCQGALVASVLGKIHKIPVVNRFHGTDVTEKNLQSIRDRMILFDQISGLKAGCNAVIMTNDGTKGDVILRALGIDRSRIRFWMNGIDSDDLSVPAASEVENLRSELGLQGKRVLLMISRLAVWKRIDRGIYCLSEIRKMPGYEDLHLLIVGQGPERENLENYAESLGVSSCVHFTGKVAHHSIGSYYLLADVFLSLYDRSNLGNPLLESLFFGCPIVTVSDGSTDRLLRDGDNAFLVPLSEIETELPRKVRMILDDRNLQAGLRRKAKETFLNELVDWKERMLREHEFIEEVIAGSKGR